MSVCLSVCLSACLRASVPERLPATRSGKTLFRCGLKAKPFTYFIKLTKSEQAVVDSRLCPQCAIHSEYFRSLSLLYTADGGLIDLLLWFFVRQWTGCLSDLHVMVNLTLKVKSRAWYTNVVLATACRWIKSAHHL